MLRNLIAATALLLASTTAQADPSWRAEKRRDGIEVYSRASPISDFREFQGQVEMQATIDDVLDVINDPSLCPQWLQYCVGASNLPSSTPNVTVLHNYNDAPWPVKDRDAIIWNVHKRQSATKYRIDFEARPDLLPEEEGYIRVPSIKGHWILTQRDEDTVHILYQVLADPGGQMPAWAANIGAVEQPYESLRKLRILVEARSKVNQGPASAGQR